ncbi:histone protein [Streptomyces sp. NPDC005494]|uniref:histone protein n=1 Tax=Streptomyces sp. NPDC005494 TaxID=3364715 RepID=UPI00369C1D22
MFLGSVAQLASALVKGQQLMRNTTKIALAAAVAGGYVLGRTKNGRLAFTVATYLAGRRFGLDPGQLMAQGLTKLKETPQFAEITDQLRSEALDAGKKALGAAADHKLADLAGSLHQRTSRLGSAETTEDEDEYEAEGEDEEGYEEPVADEEEEQSEEKEDEPTAKSPSKSAVAKKTAPAEPVAEKTAKQAPAKKTATRAPARKAAAKKSAARTPAPKKAAKKNAAKKTPGREPSTRR